MAGAGWPVSGPLTGAGAGKLVRNFRTMMSSGALTTAGLGALLGKVRDGRRRVALDLGLEVFFRDVGDADGLIRLVRRHAGVGSRLRAGLNIRAVARLNVLVRPSCRLHLLEQLAGPADGPRPDALGHPLEIESLAKRRLADEYDAGQARGGRWRPAVGIGAN